MSAGIVDIATATTGQHVANSYFDSIGLTDEWIRRRTGVVARWWMDPADPLEDAAARVCAPLVGRHRERVDITALIVVSSSTGGAMPGIAQLAAKKAGLATDILAFDMTAACSGFVYGMITALSLCESADSGAVLVCAVEAMSRMLDKTDRNTAPLFGTGAAAAPSLATYFGSTAGTPVVTEIALISCAGRRWIHLDGVRLRPRRADG
jgi:3-oxoacyl-[acyl-carrier-protein] synthase-3